MLQKISFVAVVLVLGLGGLARADVPKPEDMATCNSEAKEAARKGSAAPSTPAPNAADERRAGDVRRQDGSRTDGTGAGMRSADPQIEGIDAQGAKNPIYQAAYRTCMRKNGY
jgi:hypothetical protein